MTWEGVTNGELGETWSHQEGHEFRGYLTRQLRRRGFVHHARLEEALDVVHQILTVERLTSGALPDQWPALRARLDRVVHAATRELRQRGAALTEEDEARLASARNTARDVDGSERGERLRDRVERLPAAQRLVVKLKNTEVFFPGLGLDHVSGWRPDEADYLQAVHQPRRLPDIEAELLTRLQLEPNRHDGKVPATIIAWLLGRASAGAVDSAYNTIKNQLRRSIDTTGAAVGFAPSADTIRMNGPSWSDTTLERSIREHVRSSRRAA